RINSFRADSGQSRYARARWLAPTCSYGTNVKARRSLAPRGVLDGDAYAALRKQAARMRSRGLLQFPSAGDNSGGDGAYFNITNNPRWLSVSLFWPEPSCVSVNTRTLPSGLAKPEIGFFEPTMVTPPVAVTL